MQTVIITGRFVGPDQKPVDGQISFRPSKIWVEEGDAAYPVPAPAMELREGGFRAELIRTDQHDAPWHYVVDCPVGKWTITITEDGPIRLRTLLPERFSG